MIMGMDEEVAEARHWIANHLSLKTDAPISVRLVEGRGKCCR
jgi:hypothetical protein